ncbi:MAG: MBL fold metallo-hydrolase [Pseudomonadota bacterium]|nr:MBL fold metallo-hydrolase [Pseudomonadota bacterium]
MRFFLIPILLTFASISFADVMRVTILGSGTPRPDINRFSQSILIEAGGEKLLFDTGRGSAIRLSQANINIGDINEIFLTHLHSDHTLGMPDVIMTGWIYQRKKTLNIYGPEGTKAFIKDIKSAFKEDIKIRVEPPESHSEEGLKTKSFEIQQGQIFKKGQLSVTAFDVDHGGGVKHAFGYKIIYKNRSVVISGDTNYSSNLVSYAKNSDLLIHEIADAPLSIINKYPKVEGLMNYHTTPEEMARVINEAKPRYTVLTHMLLLGGISETDVLDKVKNLTNNKAEVELAYDLMAIDVKDNIRTYSIDYEK